MSKRDTARQLLFDDTGKLVGWENLLTGEVLLNMSIEKAPDNLAFSGIHIVNPELFEMLPEAAPYPIIPEYLKIAQNHKILAFKHLAEDWLDVGKPETLKLAQNFIKITK